MTHAASLSDLHLGDVAVLELRALVNKRRVVAHDVVDRDARGEGNTTLKVLALLASESLLHLLLDHRIHSSANCRNIGSWYGKLDSLGQTS